MKRSRVLLISVFSLFLSATALAQPPLDVPVRIKLIAQDTSSLAAYNIYDFNYINGTDTLTSSFIVLKENDSVSRSRVLEATLTKVTSYTVVPASGERKAIVLPAWEGIEVSNADDPGKKSYLNFDITQPDAVLLLKNFAPATIND